MEVGPLARVVIGYMNGTGGIKVELDKVLRQFNAELPTAYSVLGRHVARLIEGKILVITSYSIHYTKLYESAPPERPTWPVPSSAPGRP